MYIIRNQSYLEEFFVNFKWEDIHRLVFALDTQWRRIFRRAFLRHDRIPFLNQESWRDGIDGDRDRACLNPFKRTRIELVNSERKCKSIIFTNKRFVLFLFTIGFSVQINVDVVDDW